MLCNTELHAMKQATQNKSECITQNNAEQNDLEQRGYYQWTSLKKNPAEVTQRHSAYLESVQILLKQNEE